MALEFLCSDVIIQKKDDFSKKEIPRNPDANSFRIQGRKLKQYANGDGKNFTEDTNYLQVSAERHYGYIHYTCELYNSDGNILKTVIL